MGTTLAMRCAMKLLSAVALAMVACVLGAPTLIAPAFINLGTPITVAYQMTDNLDGRTIANKKESTTGQDWVGLFKKGDCVTPANNQDRHKCYIAWQRIPAEASSGTLVFQQTEYKSSGEFELRYFYGDNPNYPNTQNWRGQGWVCDTYTDASTYDPNVENKCVHCPGGTCTTVPDCSHCPGYTSATCDPTKSVSPLQSGAAACAAGICTAASHTYMRPGCIGFMCAPIDHQAGRSKVEYLSASQCACDATLNAQNVTFPDNVVNVVDKATCVRYHSACGRCSLNSVASSNVVTVKGSGGIDMMQDTSSLPGFEIMF